jgi:predicted RNase H-like HicB family nuclease
MIDRVKTYRVKFERDETGTYAVTVPKVPGCITQARSIPEGLAYARDALGLLIGEEGASEAELLADVVGVSDPTAA